MKRTLLLLSIVGLLIASPTSAIFGAEVVTDTSYYAPGDTALISGSGYQPDQVVTIQITPLLGAPDLEPWDVTADQYGSFTTSWEIPIDAIVPDTMLIEGVVPDKEPTPNTSVVLGLKTYLNQLQNGTSTAAPSWSNGNINSSNSCYSEGRLVPFRYFIKSADASTEHFFTIQCEWTKNGKHAYDYYADYDISEAAGILSAGGVCGTISTSPPPGCFAPTESFAFPDPTDAANYAGTLPGDFFQSGFALDTPMNLHAYNVTIDSLSDYWFTGSDPNYEFNAKVYFTVESTGSVGFFWGGHLAESTSDTWGTGNGSGSIGGASYHMRALELDGGGGANQDRSIQNTALCTPPNAAITCSSDSVCTGSTYTCGADTGAISYDWTVTGGTIVSGQGTNSITYTVTAAYGGSVTVSLYACNDQSGCPGDYCCSEETVELQVGNCCDPPLATCPNDTTILVCNLDEICLPGFACTHSATVIGGYLDGNSVCFTPTTGLNTITLICTNECGDADTCAVDVTVVVNTPPVCNLPSDGSYFICSDSTFAFPVSATDIDANLVGCTMTSGDGSFDGSTWTFTTSGAGTYTGTFECEDACGETCGGTVTITVAQNSAPVCNLPSDGSYFLCGDSTFAFPVSATDIDANLVGCTMTSGDGSFDGSTWTFTATGPGTYSASFECVDECGETCTGPVSITIDYNVPPVCNLPDDAFFFVCGDTTFSFPISATDDNLVGCTMTSGDGSFDGSTWTFTATATGTYTGTFECVDACGETCGGTVTITVAVNSAPVCSVPGDMTIFQCVPTPVSLPVSATDEDDNLVECSIDSGPGDLVGGNWNYTPTGNDTVTVTIVCVDDCGATCEGVFTIIFDMNDAPLCTDSDLGTVFICSDTTFVLPVAIFDADDNLAACDLISGPGAYADGEWTFTTIGPGVYSADIECTDECGASCTSTVTIAVELNSAPVCEIPGDQTFLVCGDTTFNFPILAVDPDGNLVGCAMMSGVGSFDGSTWTFETSESNTYSATFECVDACGETCTGSATMTVHYNAAPSCDLPDDASYFICGDTTFNIPISAIDPDGNLVGCSKVSGPGTFDGSTWTFTAAATGMYSGTFECGDECGATCGGTVNIEVTRNSAPVCHVPTYTQIRQCEPTPVSLQAYGTDADNNLASCALVGGSPGDLVGGFWHYTPTGSETVNVTMQCTDACGETCAQSFQIEFVIDEIYCIPPLVTIEKTHDSYQGHYEHVSITLENNPLMMGGFDFLITYDASALTPMEALPGQLLENCGWEYFTYRFGVQGNCEGPCPSGLLRIVALAETNNGPNHPDCFGPPDTDPHELVVMKFYVTNDRSFECQYVPIKFYWSDCGDNSISSVDGDVLYIDSRIYAYDIGLIWDEDDDDQFPEDARPIGLGARDYCLNPDPEKPSAIRFLEFQFGGIDIVCADSIDARGDLNLNDVANEIADGVLYTNYFIYGLSVFTVRPEGQIAASDVNNDGRILTVGDLVYLIRIITGDALPIAKLTPYANGIELNVERSADAYSLTAKSTVDVGAARFVFDLNDPAEAVEVRVADDVDGMTVLSDVVDGQLRVLVYSLKGNRIAAGENEILTVTSNGDMELIGHEVVDYYGNDLTVLVKDIVLPTQFTVTQNFPNPFNPVTEILLSLPHASDWSVTIYNIAGQKVRSYKGSSAAGEVSVIWDGFDETGGDAASGIYFYRVSAGDFSVTKKMVLMK
ncbi:MAG: T9SS type A sorting domain-containing protein [Candidatus Zixiibacteriota bacterium]